MTFYFYDLETSSINPRTGRIMQFAGQRTDADFNPIGKPFKCLVKLTEEVVPEPEAILVHGVTPQKTIEEGFTEAEFLRHFNQEVLQPNTIILGYNTIRFDDEFMRYTLWRNFHDAYEWQWRDGRGRWDLINVVRMTRALRPDGIQWPISEDGRPTNRLEMLSQANGIVHEGAHDALNDVNATIELAKLLKAKQPKIFDFLLTNRDKKQIAKLLDPRNPQPLVHSSGMYSSDFCNTSVCIPIAHHPSNPGAVLVYDLRYNPEEFATLSIEELRARAFTSFEELKKRDLNRLPVKGIYLNRAPAIAPLGVLDEGTQKRIGLTLETIESHRLKLTQPKGFSQRIHDAMRETRQFNEDDADQMLYAGFVPKEDTEAIRQVRNRDSSLLKGYKPTFEDHRLTTLYARYKARNYPDSLDDDEKSLWSHHVKQRLSGNISGAIGLKEFSNRLVELSQRDNLTEAERFLLQEMQLYGESLLSGA